MPSPGRHPRIRRGRAIRRANPSRGYRAGRRLQRASAPAPAAAPRPNCSGVVATTMLHTLTVVAWCGAREMRVDRPHRIGVRCPEPWPNREKSRPSCARWGILLHTPRVQNGREEGGQHRRAVRRAVIHAHPVDPSATDACATRTSSAGHLECTRPLPTRCRPSSRMPTCRKTCSRTPSTAQARRWRSSRSRRTSQRVRVTAAAARPAQTARANSARRRPHALLTRHLISSSCARLLPCVCLPRDRCFLP